MPELLNAVRSLSTDAESRRRLASAFKRAVEEPSEQTMPALKVAAVDFVDRLKLGGMTPERVIIALKTALRAGTSFDEGWFPSLDVGNSWVSSHSAAAIYERLFGWCVDAYFGETEGTVRRRAVASRRRPSPTTAWPATH